MKVVWSSTAIEDLKDLRAFIGQDDPAAAAATARKILASVEQLLAFPGSGRPGRVPGTREMPGTTKLAPTGTPKVLRDLSLWTAAAQHQANRLALELRRKPDFSSHSWHARAISDQSRSYPAAAK